MKEQSKLVRTLIGSWQGAGVGPQGPFEVRADFEERGRWILLRHQISPPGVKEPFYVSTQVFGFDDAELTLDYFDTAGSFHFKGDEIAKGLEFKWTHDEHKKSSGDLWKVSKYEFDSSTVVRFNYQSGELQEGGATKVLEFSGELKRK